jgi:hypothetical protein
MMTKVTVFFNNVIFWRVSCACPPGWPKHGWRGESKQNK